EIALLRAIETRRRRLSQCPQKTVRYLVACSRLKDVRRAGLAEVPHCPGGLKVWNIDLRAAGETRVDDAEAQDLSLSSGGDSARKASREIKGHFLVEPLPELLSLVGATEAREPSERLQSGADPPTKVREDSVVEVST